MEGFKSCPSCYTDVDVVVVKRESGDADSNYYFVNCKECGKGTTEAFESIKRLQSVWNEFVIKEKQVTSF
jgi:uncharacterized Zn finger protein